MTDDLVELVKESYEVNIDDEEIFLVVFEDETGYEDLVNANKALEDYFGEGKVIVTDRVESIYKMRDME